MFRRIEGEVVFVGRSAALGGISLQGKNSQVVLPGWRLTYGLVQGPLHGSMAPQTPQRGVSLWARSVRRRGMSWGCDEHGAPESMNLSTVEEGQNT